MARYHHLCIPYELKDIVEKVIKDSGMTRVGYAKTLLYKDPKFKKAIKDLE